MTKQELLAAVEAKKGFHSVISDELARDHVEGDPIEKRCLYINHENGDGTMGKTYVYYLLDTQNDKASFYNVETENLDSKEPNTEQKKLNNLVEYVATKYHSYFVVRFDLEQPVLEAEVYTLEGGIVLRKKTVLVFKKGGTISDLDVI